MAITKIRTAPRRTIQNDQDTSQAIKGVSFDGVHSFRDWGLYLKERPKISPPEPKTAYVSVPGRDGDIDISTALTGEIKYADREIEIHFSTFDNVPYWSTLYSKIQNYLHGKERKIIFDDDPEFYYIGRISVEPMESDGYRGYLNLTITAQPFKKDNIGSLDDWLWDPFNFYTGVIISWGNLTVSGTETIEIDGSRQTVVPKFTVTSGSVDVTVKWGTETHTEHMGVGEYEFYSLRIRDGKNVMTIKGNATIKIDYRAGSL